MALVGNLTVRGISVGKLPAPCVGTLQVPRITEICRNFAYASIFPLHERERRRNSVTCAAQFRRRGKEAEERIDFDGATATHENGHLELD